MQNRTPPLDHAALHFRWAGGGGVYYHSQAGAVVALANLLRQFQYANQMRGHELGVSHPVHFNGGQGALGIELLAADGGAPVQLRTHGPSKRRGVVEGAGAVEYGITVKTIHCLHDLFDR